MSDVFSKDKDGNVTINVDVLERGQYISPAEICKAYAVEMGGTKYSFAVLGICGYIEQRSAADDDPMIVKGENYGIRILAHEEAVDYVWTLFKSRIAGLRRDDRRFSSISTGGLDSERKREYEHRAHVIRTTTIMASKNVKKLGVPIDEPPYLPGIDGA